MITRSARRAHFRVAAAAFAISAAVLPTSKAQAVCDSDGPAGTPYVRGVNCRTITIDGYDREFIVYVTTNTAFDLADPSPLVVALHGGGGTAGNMFRNSGWQDRSDRRGVVVIFGQGLEYYSTEKEEYTKLWNGYGVEDEVDSDLKPAGYPDDSPWPADDIGFLGGAVDDVDALMEIDDDAVFVTGFSNGGRMCMRVAVQMSDRVKAAGCFAGGLNEVPRDTPLARIPIMWGRGASDPKAIQHVNEAERTNLSELPMTWAEFQDYPSLLAQLNPNLTTFGLHTKPTSLHETDRKMVLRFQSPADPNDPDVSCLHYVHLQGVVHQYPSATNNPQGFDAARKFGKFFMNTPAGCQLD